jgi:hypothetical protein
VLTEENMMNKYRLVLILWFLCIAVIFNGCIQKTITDQRLIDAMQAYLDSAPDPTNDALLTPEERATVTTFEIYKNIIKVHLVEGTPTTMWDPVGRKIVKIFAKANRDVSILNDSYYVELFIPGMLNDQHHDNLYIGNMRLQNASDRVFPELGNPRLER